MSDSKLASVHVLKPEVRTERRRLSAVQAPGRPKRGRWVMLAAGVFALAANRRVETAGAAPNVADGA